MPISYVMDRDRGLILEQWTGEVSAAELERHWRQVLSDPEFTAIGRSVVDVRDATIAFLGAELEALVDEIVIPAMKGRQWVTALIVSHPVHRGVSNQYGAFAESYSQDRIFTDPDEAVSWTLTQPRPL